MPLAAILNEAGLTGRATHIRAEGWDEGVPATAEEGTEPFFYDKGLPLQKALHPDTILAYAQNGQVLEHLHGAPIRLSGSRLVWKLVRQVAAPTRGPRPRA